MAAFTPPMYEVKYIFLLSTPCSFCSHSRKQQPHFKKRALDDVCIKLYLRSKQIFHDVLLLMEQVLLVSSQKPKQKNWHPPDGFILGLWTLILLVFFKTYGIKHLKHIFWGSDSPQHRRSQETHRHTVSEARISSLSWKSPTLALFVLDLVRNRFFIIFLMQVCCLWVLLCIIFWKWHALTFYFETFFVVLRSL